jgi:integrase
MFSKKRNGEIKMQTKTEAVKLIKKSDGKNYSVRVDRRRFFFPEEWNAFIKTIKNTRHKNLFEFMINTGSRIDEALHIRPGDFDFERNNVRLWKTKTLAKKGEKQGKPRTISLSSEFTRKMKRYYGDRDKGMYIWMTSLNNINQIMKRKLQKAGIKDWYNFSTHNIRKTHGMYLKALGIDIGEICMRLGHDVDTYLKHYGSADVFSDKDMRQIKEILGDIYMRQRRF